MSLKRLDSLTPEEIEYNVRLRREKEKAREKYGDACTDPLGNLAHDAQDYAIGELVGLDRYAEIIIARAKLYDKPDGIMLGQHIRDTSRDLGFRLIKYRNSLLAANGVDLGKPEYK